MVTRRHPTLPTNRLTTTPLRQSVLSTSNDSLRQSAVACEPAKPPVHKGSWSPSTARRPSSTKHWPERSSTNCVRHGLMPVSPKTMFGCAWMPFGRNHSAMQQIAQASQSAEAKVPGVGAGFCAAHGELCSSAVDDDGNQVVRPEHRHRSSRSLGSISMLPRHARSRDLQQRAAAEQQFYAIHSHQAHVLSRREQALLGARRQHRSSLRPSARSRRVKPSSSAARR